MRLRLGRPDLTAYADRFTVPEAAPGADVTVTFLGVSTLLVEEGESAVMTDGFFSRPALGRALFGQIAPDGQRISDCLRRAGVERLDAVMPVHTHYDHALDSAVVAQRTGGYWWEELRPRMSAGDRGFRSLSCISSSRERRRSSAVSGRRIWSLRTVRQTDTQGSSPSR